MPPLTEQLEPEVPLDETNGNKQSVLIRKRKISKTSAESDASSTQPKAQKFKYCNASTLKRKLNYVNLEWPNYEEFMDDEDQDMPEDGEVIDKFCDRVSDLGIPVSEYGAKIVDKLDEEMKKRDQDLHNMHIYNDWNGWATSEVMCNLLKDFNRDLFKKTVSPFQKWAYVEGLACLFKSEELMAWMGNEDGDGVAEVVDMIAIMLLTSFDVLAEHSLFKPGSDIKNIGIMCLLMLEFASGIAADLDCDWPCEVVRLCDEAGIALEEEVRKQVSISRKEIEELRSSYKEKEEASDIGLEDDQFDGNGYSWVARKEDWTPKDDYGKKQRLACLKARLWYRWDWALDYSVFKDEHLGGRHYVISGMSKREIAACKLDSPSSDDEWTTEESF